MSLTREHFDKNIKEVKGMLDSIAGRMAELMIHQVETQNKLDDRQAQALHSDSKKVGTKRMDIVAFIKSKYIEDTTIFDRFLGDEKEEVMKQAKANAIGNNSKKLSDTDYNKKIATYIWRSKIKEIPEADAFFRNLKNEECGNNLVEIPDKGKRSKKAKVEDETSKGDDQDDREVFDDDEENF